MSTEQISGLLGTWEGHRVKSIQRFKASQRRSPAQVWIEWEPQPAGGLICSQCGRLCHQVHDRQVPRVRDLPILEAQTHLLVHHRRALCPDCGPKPERLT